MSGEGDEVRGKMEQEEITEEAGERKAERMEIWMEDIEEKTQWISGIRGQGR